MMCYSYLVCPDKVLAPFQCMKNLILSIFLMVQQPNHTENFDSMDLFKMVVYIYFYQTKLQTDHGKASLKSSFSEKATTWA